MIPCFARKPAIIQGMTYFLWQFPDLFSEYREMLPEGSLVTKIHTSGSIHFWDSSN